MRFTYTAAVTVHADTRAQADKLAADCERVVDEYGPGTLALEDPEPEENEDEDE